MVASTPSTPPPAHPEPSRRDAAALGLDTAAPSMALPQPRLGWGVWATLAWSFAAFLTGSIVDLLIDRAGRAALAGADYPAADIVERIATSIGKCTIIGVLVFAVYRSRAPIATYLGLVRPRDGRAPDTIVVGLLALVANALMLLVLAPWLGFEIRWPQPDDVMSVAVVRWLQTALIAPVMEELLYRGFLYRGLAQSRLGANGAIALTAVLFAVLHTQWVGDSTWWFQMLRIGFLGLLFGWLRERTGSVLPGIAIHALINGVQAPVMYSLMAAP